MAVIEGKLTVHNQKFAIVVSRFNSLVTTPLLEGARDCFLRHGGQEKDLTVVWVPGAAEIPQVALKLAVSGKLPRPLRKVAALPRNETGKLTAAALNALWSQRNDKP